MKEVRLLIADLDSAYVQALINYLTEQKTALETALNDALKTVVLPKASTETDEYWYTFCSTLRGNRYMHANGTGSGLTGGTASNTHRMMWKFVSRGNGTFDIINRADGSYISPSAGFNAQINTTATRPSKGWTLKPSSTIGMFIVSSGTVELNQTNLANLPIYNWSSGKDGNDITDTGCQFTIKEVDGGSVGIETIAQNSSESRFYDIVGRPVSKHHKGVAISQKGIKTMKSNH